MIREAWAEFFWSRTEKTKAAFRRGFALGFLSAIIVVSMLIQVRGPG